MLHNGSSAAVSVPQGGREDEAAVRCNVPVTKIEAALRLSGEGVEVAKGGSSLYRSAGSVKIRSAAFMQRQRHYFLCIRTLMGIPGQHATGIKGLAD
jgi:hypothetical protein